MTLPAIFYDLSFIGILYDMMGATLLSLALLLNSASSIAAQSQTHWDANSPMRRGLCEQRVDAWFGLPLLAAGFLMQAVGAAAGDQIGWPAIIILAGLPTALSFYLIFRKSMVERLEKQVAMEQVRS